MPPEAIQVFGLIGATDIAARAIVAPAARTAAIRVQAVAAGDPARAREFAAAHRIPVAHRSYLEVLADPNPTAVYISLHNSAHAQWAAQAARAGKHVVVEKPLCLSLRELHGIRQAAAEAGVRVVEALMTAGHPWLARVAQFVGGTPAPCPADRPELGRLVAVRSRMVFTSATGYRRRPELGGGILLDCAPYWLQMLQATVGLGVRSVDVRVEHWGAEGCEESCDASLHLRSGVTATLSCAFGPRHAADHEFVFEHGRVRVRGFLRPAAAALPLNLTVLVDGVQHIESFPAMSYYDAQITRLASAFAADPPSRQAAAAHDWAEVEARVAVLEDLQRKTYAMSDGGRS